MKKYLDRISMLPDSLIFSIFEMMSTRDVVATAFLSKRWRNLWTTTHCLNFVNYHKRDETFITRTLFLWRGTKILTLKIQLRYVNKHFSFSQVDAWVRFAKEHEVQELYLRPADPEDEHYPVPQYLFSSCPSLKVLSLEGCELGIDRNVRWNQLKSLTVRSDTDVSLSNDVINHILCGSPQLEVLILSFMETNEHLNVRSTSLKKLSIEKHIWDEEEALQMNTRLMLWTPNLETLKISHVPYFCCSMANVSSLTDVSLLLADKHSLFSMDDVPEKTLKQFLPIIQHVGSVTLSDWCIEALVGLKRKHLVPGFCDVKLLKLKSVLLDHEQIASVLEIFPKVKTLVIKDASERSRAYEAKSYLNFPPSLPNLTRVEVTWAMYDYFIFPLIEILLKSASNLEQMVFRVKETTPFESPYKDLFLASQKLLRMQRSSPTAKFIFCDCE